jgi:hypothetical protein
MTVELCKNSECISKAQGIIGITLVTLGYFKYIVVLIMISFYCVYFRTSREFRIVQEENEPLRAEDVDELLNNLAAPMPDSDPCSICMDFNFEEIGVKLECGHYFHKECLKDWAVTRGSCPVCRQVIMKRGE